MSPEITRLQDFEYALARLLSCTTLKVQFEMVPAEEQVMVDGPGWVLELAYKPGLVDPFPRTRVGHAGYASFQHKWVDLREGDRSLVSGHNLETPGISDTVLGALLSFPTHPMNVTKIYVPKFVVGGHDVCGIFLVSGPRTA